MNRQKKNREREKPKKWSGPSIQEIVENTMEIAEAGKSSLYPNMCSINDEMTVECTRLKLKIYIGLYNQSN